MTAKRSSPPHVRSLNKRIENLAKERGRAPERIARLIAEVVVGQMLPDGVLKGGTSIALLVGERSSRFTRDLDAAYAGNLDQETYISELEGRLEEGWHGFTGIVVPRRPPRPPGVPPEYVMVPFDIRLAYRGSSWSTQRFELGRDEIGSTSSPDRRMPPDIVELFETVGLPAPAPIPCQTVDHQISQKLHACTSTWGDPDDNERAHDLVDLQLIMADEQPDLGAVRKTATRLFASRRRQSWPPTITARRRWVEIYATAATGLEVIEDLGDAIAWGNALIAEIEQSA